ncbi:formate dehydrogenase accessory sulfurtransferase FdhD [Novosphingobium aquimarinum]|uniref:formate dehydrogenase accessory sulfurtransferase FdhD n=1 Tax=Novosphingobium aquimarinum TaxID=2682494 RepID=UPI001E4A1B9C|nr:formate dehydrogenase accessory sulfurtransferase FdhD [Novosphingobium aquimarinum]
MTQQPTEIGRDGRRRVVSRAWVPEAPVALEFNGVAYAVMMATPEDLEDFACGFAIAEGLAQDARAVVDTAVAEVEHGWIVRTIIDGLGEERLNERVRRRVAESSCGLCGIENLEALASPLPRVAAHVRIDSRAIFAAVGAISGHQRLGRATGAAHAAALAGPEGDLRLVREDVGRHNAIDKVTGAALRQRTPLTPGFLLSTARCSYEIVEKAVRAEATTLVTISLPTSLAVERARGAGLSLWALARDDSVLLVHDAGRSN